MIKKVGFSRALKLEWLNSTVEIYENKKEVDKVKVEISEYLKDKIKGNESRRKCLNILMAAWVNVPESHRFIRDKGIELYNVSDIEKKVILHWSALMMAYPIFTDIASIAGRFLYLHEAFQVSSVTKRIYELWGERDTVKYATEKIISTMSDMGVISHGEKPGEYKRGRRIVVNDPEYKLFLVNSFMLATNKKTLQYDTIEDQYPLFPFKIDLAVHEVNESETVSLNRFDNQTFVVMK